MKTKTIQRVNVAPSSTEGHFIKGAKQVINLDNVNETFLVKGESVLETKNHTSLEIKEDCLITCQMVYNPFEKMYSKSRD
jgi:hypothetical protein